MVDEHTRVSLLHGVERSITAERLVAELGRCLSWPGALRRCCGWTTALSRFPQAPQRFCERRSVVLHSAQVPWDNGYIESFNNRLRRECPTATIGPPCSKPEWYRGFQGRPQPGIAIRLSATHAGRVRCAMRHTHTPDGLRDQLNPNKQTRLNLHETRDGSPTGTFPPSGTESRLGAPNLTLAVSTERRATLNRLQFPRPTKEFLAHRQTYGDTSGLSANQFLLWFAQRRGVGVGRRDAHSAGGNSCPDGGAECT